MTAPLRRRALNGSRRQYDFVYRHTQKLRRIGKAAGATPKNSGPPPFRLRLLAGGEEFLHPPSRCRPAHRFEAVIEFAGKIERRPLADGVVILLQPVARRYAAKVAQIGQ